MEHGDKKVKDYEVIGMYLIHYFSIFSQAFIMTDTVCFLLDLLTSWAHLYHIYILYGSDTTNGYITTGYIIMAGQHVTNQFETLSLSFAECQSRFTTFSIPLVAPS